MLKLTITFFSLIFFAQATFAADRTDLAPLGSVSGAAISALSDVDPAHLTPAAAELSQSEQLEISPELALIPKAHHESSNDLFYTIDVEYPQISGENLSANTQLFNQTINKLVAETVEQFKAYVKKDLSHIQTLPDMVRQNNLHVDYDVDVIKPGTQTIVSVRLAIEGMQAGRAHPYHYHKVVNFNLTTGKVLTLNDLFKPHSSYLNFLAKQASQKLNEKLEDKWMIDQGTAPRDKNFQLWNLQGDGILLTFDEYQVAPYSAGAQEVEVPYELLKTFLANNSPMAACVKGCGMAAKPKN